MTKKTSSISEHTSTRSAEVMDVYNGHAFVRVPIEDEVATDLPLSDEWLVRKYTSPQHNGYYLLFHTHPIGHAWQYKIGLVCSRGGISDKTVGHARCMVCATVAPPKAIGFLELCKWKR